MIAALPHPLTVDCDRLNVRGASAIALGEHPGNDEPEVLVITPEGAAWWMPLGAVRFHPLGQPAAQPVPMPARRTA